MRDEGRTDQHCDPGGQDPQDRLRDRGRPFLPPSGGRTGPTSVYHYDPPSGPRPYRSRTAPCPRKRLVADHLFVQRSSRDFEDAGLREACRIRHFPFRRALAKCPADQLVALGDQRFGQLGLIADLSQAFKGVDAGHWMWPKGPAPSPLLPGREWSWGKHASVKRAVDRSRTA